MLCTSCAGTSYSVFPNEFISSEPVVDQQEFVCPDCGETQWLRCRQCQGLGCRLVRDGDCSHCGQTVSHWQRCSVCEGSGRIYLLNGCKQAAHAENSRLASA